MDRTIRKAARRIAIDLAARRAAVGLLVGAGAGFVALLVDRTMGLQLPAAVFGAIVAVGILAAIVAAFVQRPGALDVAVRLDRSLGLKDRLGTAESVRQGKVSGEFAALAAADAERIARGLDVRFATPIRIGGLWPVGLASTALLAAGIAWVPARQPPASAAAAEAIKEQRAQIARTIDEAVAGVDASTLDEETQRDLEALDAIARQMSGTDPAAARTSEARDESAARMEMVAERMADAAERNLQALDEVTKRVTDFEPPAARRGTGPPPDFAELLEKMGRGELEQAAQQAEELTKKQESMSPEERRELAEELDSLAEHLRDTSPAESAQRQNVKEALKDLGLDEASAEEALKSQDERQMQEALEERGADPETARTLARDLKELGQEEQSHQDAESLKERLAESIEKTARDIERGKDDQGAAKPPERSPDGSASQQQQGQQQGQQEQREGRGQQEQPQQQPGRQGEEQQGQQEQQGQSGDQEQRGQQERPGQQPGGSQTLPQALRELERAQRESLGRRAASERLREAARQLADTLTPEERQRLAEQWAPSPGTSGSTQGQAPPGSMAQDTRDTSFDRREDIDLRGGEEPDRPAATWLDPDAQPGDQPAAGNAADAGRAALHRARQDAEQAVEKSMVPSRYHRLIKRYFTRLDDRAPGAAPNASTPAAPGGGGP